MSHQSESDSPHYEAMSKSAPKSWPESHHKTLHIHRDDEKIARVASAGHGVGRLVAADVPSEP